MNINEFINVYKDITSECPFNTDPSDIFYYAEQEHLNSDLLAADCIEIDITAAFPTLCKYLFGETHPFVQKIFSFENKIERNKFIAINLTHNQNLSNTIGVNGLKTLNSYCKLIVLGFLYNNFENINILEYKKDGVIFSGNVKYDEFNNFIENIIGIQFHIDKVKTYLRFKKTSIFQYENKISVKGKYKDPPAFITEQIFPRIFNKDYDILFIKQYYNDLYFKLLLQGDQLLGIQHYYKFKTKFIHDTGDLNVLPSNPKNVLFHFLYPIITLLKNQI
jgi:hypothetical protein